MSCRNLRNRSSALLTLRGLCHTLRHIMDNPALNFLALGLYLAAGALIALRFALGHAASFGAKLGTLSLAAGAVILHAVFLFPGFLYGEGVNLSLTMAFSVVA